MGIMVLLKLKRRVDTSVNTQPQGMVGERPWIDELLPIPGYVQSWGVQHVPI